MPKSLTLKNDIEILNKYNSTLLIGIDEVGRGCWAGPVCVAGFALNIKSYKIFDGVNDSKLVSKKNRDALNLELIKNPHIIKTGKVKDINKLGIGKTITNCIAQIVQEFKEFYKDNNPIFLIDGQFKQDFGENTIKQNKSDSNYYSVASASIIAKVYRDNLMDKLDLKYKEYDFKNNKGYPAPKHLSALAQHGVSKIHRTSFTPIAKMLELQNENN